MKLITRLMLAFVLTVFIAACSSSGGTQEAGLPASGGITPPVIPAATQTTAATATTALEATASPASTGTTELPTQTSAATPTTAVAPQTATALPEPAGYEWRLVVDGLKSPIGMASTADGSGRLFVIEKAGRIRMIVDGQLANTPFLDIRDRVGSSGSEQGLLGLAFHPAYGQNGYFYVNYTDKNGNTVIARYQASGDQADPNSEKQLITQDQPYQNHNGGGLAFGPDGYLYAGLGDGGSAGDPHGNGQSLDTLLGKLLRIDVDNGEPYGIPADNPFATSGGRAEIWAYGLRNPWRFSFDPATGDLYIGDVGQNKYEEVDFVPAGTEGGLNFGWNFREGLHEYQGTPPSGVTLVDPVAEYSHSDGCSITGGNVYRGAMPEWQGVFFYADWCSGMVWGLLHKADGSFENQVLFTGQGNVTAFGQDQNGEVYLVDYNGRLLRLEQKQ